MTHVILVWELGFGVSYAKHMSLLATALQSNHKVTVIARDVAITKPLLPKDVELYPAPIYQTLLTEINEDTAYYGGTYADILSANNYNDNSSLLALLQSWDFLFEKIKPDMIICEHSPTAILAAKGRWPILQIGSGVLTPWKGHTVFPALVEGDTQQARQMKFMSNINQTLNIFQAPQLKKFGDIFASCEQIVCSMPIFDPDKTLRSQDAIGPLEFSAFENINQDNKQRSSIYVYINDYHPQLQQLLLALTDFKQITILNIRNCRAELRHRLEAYGFKFTDGDNYQDLMNTAKLLIHYGGLAMSQEALMRGVPQLILPMHGEQVYNGEIIKALGAGVYTQSNIQKESIRNSIHDFVSGSNLQQKLLKNATGLVKKYEDKPPISVLIKHVTDLMR